MNDRFTAPRIHRRERAQLMADARELGLTLSERDAERMLRLLDELAVWSQRFNLTAIRGREAMIRAHLLDSLSAHADIAGRRVADVGTGAGFPGLPLAVVQPARQFTLIDATAKKLRFVEHAARELDLCNVETLHARAETLSVPRGYDTVIARAVAPLPELLSQVRGLCTAETLVVALKGRYPAAELARLPRGWRIQAVRAVHVPGLPAERHILRLVPEPD